MSRAIITDGLWIRNVSWQNRGVWRTDMFKSVLADPRLKVAEFRLRGGPSVRVPMQELKRVLLGGTDHYGGQIWGPFNIDPKGKTIDGERCNMEVVD